MKLGVDISPDLAKLMAAEIAAGQRAVTQGVREVGEQLKADWRKQITGAGLGQRLALTIRSRHYPAGRESFGAAAMVWSKAPQIVAGHDEGALLRSADGFWLAIPTPAAKQMFRREQATPPSSRSAPVFACASSTEREGPASSWLTSCARGLESAAASRLPARLRAAPGGG